MPSTIQVRIAVAVDPNGKWHAVGWSGLNPVNGGFDYYTNSLDPGEAHYPTARFTKLLEQNPFTTPVQEATS